MILIVYRASGSWRFILVRPWWAGGGWYTLDLRSFVSVPFLGLVLACSGLRLGFPPCAGWLRQFLVAPLCVCVCRGVRSLPMYFCAVIRFVLLLVCTFQDRFTAVPYTRRCVHLSNAGPGFGFRSQSCGFSGCDNFSPPRSRIKTPEVKFFPL